MSALPMLSAAARSVLAAAIVDGNLVRLTSGQLARTLYEEVNEALVRIGGKWKNGKTQAHAFSYQDPAPLVAGLVASGVMPPKNPFAFFPTPPAVVESMLTSLDIDAFPSAEDDSYWSELGREGGLRILEPSAGTGAIADALHARLPRATLECCELNPLCAAVLRRKGYTVFEGDFLAFTPSAAYARIALNPPFSVTGDVRAYQSHIRHAHAMLAKGGSLVAIAPPGFLTGTSKADRAFRDFVYEHSQGYGVEEIPAGTFAESGTSVATVLMRLLAEPTGRAPVSGSHCWHCREAKLIGDSNSREYERMRIRIAERRVAGELSGSLSDPSSGVSQAVDAYYDDVIRLEKLPVALLPACRAHLRREFVEDMAYQFDLRDRVADATAAGPAGSSASAASVGEGERARTDAMREAPEVSPAPVLVSAEHERVYGDTLSLFPDVAA
ncbi:MAG: methyltransferase [Gemmatimonadaceae bacterium]